MKNFWFIFLFCFSLPIIRIIWTDQYIHFLDLFSQFPHFDSKVIVNTFKYKLHYLFLFWNLFLAYIPVYLAKKSVKTENIIISFIFSFLWLIFFPNALYIFTDFIHLNRLAISSVIPVWFDIIMLYSFSIFGLLLGFYSLEIMKMKYNNFLFPIIVLAVSSFGIYLGRFERLNSWDIFTNPSKLILKITNSLNTIESIIFSLFIFFFLYALYTIFSKINYRD